MTLTTSEAMQAAFLEATRNVLQRDLHTAQDWDRYKAIIAETDARVVAEEQAHARQYEQRIAEAKQMILREEHSVRLDQPLPPGVDKVSDPQELQRKADARVRQDFERRCAVIRKDELELYRDLTAEIRERTAQERSRDLVSEQSRNLQQDWNQSVSRSGPTRT